MRQFSSTLCALALLASVQAVFKDEIDHIDYHYELLGVPRRETTFFHKPRPEDKASLLYTLSDVGVLGAVNPSSGTVVWRQQLSSNINITTSGAGHLRAGQGQNSVVAAYGGAVHAWDAVGGRNVWKADFEGEVKDLEILELGEKQKKDVLLLSSTLDGVTIVRRLDGESGDVIWQFQDSARDTPLQVSANLEKIFVVTLHGNLLSYSLKVTVLDPVTGKRVDELSIGTKGDVSSPADVTFVGANSAAPFIAWTDDALSKLKVNVLGTKTRQEFALHPGTTSVEIHAPHLAQSLPHFLVHSRTTTGNKAEVYHVNLKSNTVTKAYDLPHVAGAGAISISSDGANVHFTRITNDEVSIVSSVSHGILARWPLKTGSYTAGSLHAVSEVIGKSGNSFAVRSAVVTNADDWIMLRNGDLSWSRPEGMTAAVAAAWAEVPQSGELAKTLEAEAHSNPWSAYVHRVQRHFDDLRYLPDYLVSLPQRVLGGIVGKLGGTTSTTAALSRDSFGFNKVVVLATSRGRLYGLSTGQAGRMLWTRQAFPIEAGKPWDVKGIDVDNVKGTVVVRGADGEYIIVKTDTGKTIENMPRGSWPAVESTVLVDTPSGKFMLTIGADGKVGDIPVAWTPKETVVIRSGNILRGVKFLANGANAQEETTWSFAVPSQQRVVGVATRPAHDPVASIGRVRGDRTVRYKYLTANTVAVAAVDEMLSTLTTYLIDTISGEVLYTATYQGIDTVKPVHLVMSENWFATSFFGDYTIQNGKNQALKGYQVVISDLFESDVPNDRGPLDASVNSSSLKPIRSPTAESHLPSVSSQTFILGGAISALAVTETRQGITSRQLLAYLAESHAIYAIPRHILEPRRVVGRDPTPLEQEEGLVRYQPSIEIDPKLVLTHERDVLGVQKIITSPATVESTSLVFAFGIDVFGTRTAPSFLFDILGVGFNKVTLMGTVVALTVGVLALGPIVRSKQINGRWRPAV